MLALVGKPPSSNEVPDARFVTRTLALSAFCAARHKQRSQPVRRLTVLKADAYYNRHRLPEKEEAERNVRLLGDLDTLLETSILECQSCR